MTPPPSDRILELRRRIAFLESQVEFLHEKCGQLVAKCERLESQLRAAGMAPGPRDQQERIG